MCIMLLSQQCSVRTSEVLAEVRATGACSTAVSRSELVSLHQIGLVVSGTRAALRLRATLRWHTAGNGFFVLA